MNMVKPQVLVVKLIIQSGKTQWNGKQAFDENGEIIIEVIKRNC